MFYNYDTEPMTLDVPEVAFSADDAEQNILGGDEEAFSADDAAAVGLAFGADEDLAYQLGWSPFKAISGAVKSVAKAVTKPAATIKKAVKTVSKVAKTGASLGKTLVNSPIVKATVAGAAIVFPPVGVPAAAAMAVATGIVAATKSKNPAQKAAATQVVKNTAAQAKAGDKNAQVALATMSNVALAAKARAAAMKPAPVAAKPAIQTPVRAALPAPKPVVPATRIVTQPAAKPANVKHRIVVDVLPSGFLSTTRV